MGAIASCFGQERGMGRAPVWSKEPPSMPQGTSWEQLRLCEPLHKRSKLKRVKRRPELVQAPRLSSGESTVRPLIGFMTSGALSYKRGVGAGVGVVAVSALTGAMQD